MKNTIDVINKLARKPKKYFDLQLSRHFPKLKIEFDKHNPPIVYGAGTVGKAIYDSLKINMGIEVKILADGDKKLLGKYIGNAKIISKEKLEAFIEEPIIVASVIYEREIYDELISKGFTKVYPLSYLNYLFPQVFNFRKYNKMYLSLFKSGVRKK